MALTIEDGTVVSSANSYITDAEFTAYADSRGFTYPTTAALREPLIIRAMDYLENQPYKGWRVDPDNQLLPFPRSNVWSNGRVIDSTEIPRELKSAQNEAAIAAYTQDLQINTVTENVASESLGSLSISYHNRGKSGKIRLDRVMNYLASLLTVSDSLVRT